MTKKTTTPVAEDAELVEVVSAPAPTPAPQKETAPVVSQHTGILAVIERAALDPNVDIEKMERLLAMKERLDERTREDEARAAERSFIASLGAAQAEVPVVLRTRKNKFADYTYADLADIENQAMPVIRKHGFSVRAWGGAGAEPGFQRVFFRVAHVDGHTHEIHDDFPLDGSGTGGKTNKTAIQAKGSTTSYGRRYLLCGYFGIATADDDGRATTHAQAPSELSAKQAARLRQLIEQSETEEPKFLAHARAESVEEIDPSLFATLEQMLLMKIKKAEMAKAEATAAE
ncbi:MAG: ERF family protein [Alkalilacustris sp.]